MLEKRAAFASSNRLSGILSDLRAGKQRQMGGASKKGRHTSHTSQKRRKISAETPFRSPGAHKRLYDGGCFIDTADLLKKDFRMPEGTIKRLTDKGFGFISTGAAKDLFFHSSKVVDGAFDQLFEGQKVSFTEGQGPKGPQAENVKPV